MTILRNFIDTRFGVLMNHHDCSEIDYMKSGSNEMLVFEIDFVQIRFIRDRGQFFAEFRAKASDKAHKWYSFGVLKKLIAPESDWNEELNSENVRFLGDHFDELLSCFVPQQLMGREAALHEIERLRAKQLFGGD